jgi:hypothetical protein
MHLCNTQTHTRTHTHTHTHTHTQIHTYIHIEKESTLRDVVSTPRSLRMWSLTLRRPIPVLSSTPNTDCRCLTWSKDCSRACRMTCLSPPSLGEAARRGSRSGEGKARGSGRSCVRRGMHGLAEDHEIMHTFEVVGFQVVVHGVQPLRHL